ncbi:transposase family protein [Streptomyces chartreusis]|uniref:transposase family protein n=1 Tax=Streptomyces chartreusis TaxID=1969 RepID=UPI003817ABCB
MWVSDISPGSVHDLTAARHLVLPALHTTIRNELKVLADIGYIGYIGAPGLTLPVRTHPDLPQDLDPDNKTYTTLPHCNHAKGERAIAEHRQRGRALQHLTLSPNRIGAIPQAALALNKSWRS